MTRSALLHALCVLPALFLPTLAVDNDTDPSLNAALKSAATQLDYLNLLGSDSDWVYDFNKNPKYTFTPGGVANANAATFPAATGYDMTLAMLNLGPCAMLPPHFHPRAPNFAVVVQGTVETWMIQENGARTVKTVLTEGMMTIFPEGAVHGMRNLGCGNAQLVSALGSADTGTTNMANNLFNFPDDILSVIFGVSEDTIDSLRAAIPPIGTGSNAGNETCLATCGVSNSTSTSEVNTTIQASSPATSVIADASAFTSAAFESVTSASTEADGYGWHPYAPASASETTAPVQTSAQKKGKGRGRMVRRTE